MAQDGGYVGGPVGRRRGTQAYPGELTGATPQGEEEEEIQEQDVYGFPVEEQGDILEEYERHAKARVAKEAELCKKWESLFLKFKRKDDELFQSSQFKKLVAKGIPVQYRGFVWYTFSGAAERASKANMPDPSSNPSKRPGKSRAARYTYYQDLQRQLKNLTTGSRRISAALEIEKDLRRTFPGHPLFESEDGKAILRRVLLAYALRNPHIGYCQSMNVLAGLILLVTQPSLQHQYHDNQSEQTATPSSSYTSAPSSPQVPHHQRQSSQQNLDQSTPQPSSSPPQTQPQSQPSNTTTIPPSQTTTTGTPQPQTQTQFQPPALPREPSIPTLPPPPQAPNSPSTNSRHQRKPSSLPANLAEQWEERAFWILVEMIEGRCIDYYTRTLKGSQIDLRVLAQILAIQVPHLTTHFETLGLSLPLLATRWFMCVFALVLPVETALHVWDQVLVHSKLVGDAGSVNEKMMGRDLIILFAASLLQCTQEKILQNSNGSVSDVVIILDQFPRSIYNKKILLRQYKAVSQRIPPGGDVMAKLRNSATEYVEAETKDIKRARDLMQAGRQTKFSSLELSEIHAMLYKSAATSRSDRGSIFVGSEGFQNILSHIVPGIAQSPAMLRLFKALDQNNDNKLDFREMIVGLSILAKGSLDEKLELLFKSFDVDGTGYITQAQLESLITSVSTQMDPEHPDKYSSMGSGVVGTDPLGVKVVPVSVFVSQVFAHLCITSGKLDLDQFRQAVIAEPRLLECLIPGADQEDVEISIPATPPPEERHSLISTSYSNSSKSGGSLRVKGQVGQNYANSNSPNNTSSNNDSPLALGVTDSDAQTPLLADAGDADSSGGDKKESKKSDSGCCCVLL